MSYYDKCPICKEELKCLGGSSAHWRNWYCSDEKECGWTAWEPYAIANKSVEEGKHEPTSTL